jgi:hypothetical protein
MKRFLTTVLAILLADCAFSQNSDSIKVLADQAVKMFTWDIQKAKRGNLMFLDVPYKQDNQDSAEYLTLTVAKTYSGKRPEFISIIIPGNVVQANGIFLAFAKTSKDENGEWRSDMEKVNPVRVHFEKCADQICTARILDGYVIDEESKEKIDIFQKFEDFDHVYFLFIYPDGSHKSISVPLFSFKEQYKSL